MAAPVHSHRMEIGEKPGCGMFPARNEFEGPPDEFGQRTHICCNRAQKNQAVTAMQPSPAKSCVQKGLTRGEAAPRSSRA